MKESFDCNCTSGRKYGILSYVAGRYRCIAERYRFRRAVNFDEITPEQGDEIDEYEEKQRRSVD